MAKDHGPSIKDDKQYEGLRKKGMSKSRAAAIANTPDASGRRAARAPAAVRAARAAGVAAAGTAPRRLLPAARAARSPADLSLHAAESRVSLGQTARIDARSRG